MWLLAGSPGSAADSALLVWLTFDEDWSAAGYIADSSGGNRHAYRYGRPQWPTNWPVRVVATTTPGTNGGGYCGEYWWLFDGWGLYGRSGAYAGVATNVAALTNMNVATVALFARYYNVTNATTTNATWNLDQVATLLGAGLSGGQYGSWVLGREYRARTSMYIVNAPFSEGVELLFGDDASATQGDTLTWHHYAVTWSNGQAVAYFDGSACGSTNVAGVTNLVIGTYPGKQPWLSVGGNSHAGTPFMEDGEEFPNHGWFNGVLDDVRIYNRVLSGAEVGDLARGTTATGSSTATAAALNAGAVYFR